MEQKGTNTGAGGCKTGTRFEARLALVPVVVELVAAQMRHAGAAPDAVMRAGLILEELFRNSVLHGYGGDSGRPVWIYAQAAGFCYEDEAPAFNPLAERLVRQEPNPDLPAADQPIGGAGLMLIRQLARRAEYVRHDKRNCLLIEV
jgi:anti-sigma regulatory factor (Ser/Thr protein kinase)